jgi:Rod binding domain-containing protein
MSLQPSGATPAAPVTAQALEPAWVRRGSAAVQRDYALGLQFEKMLTEQLAGALSASAGLGGEATGEEPAAASSGAGMLGAMLPSALAGSVTAGGGLGLAAELTRQMAGRLDAAAPATGGVAPHTPSAPSVGTEAGKTGGTAP